MLGGLVMVSEHMLSVALYYCYAEYRYDEYGFIECGDANVTPIIIYSVNKTLHGSYYIIN
jgi:hypothetical protein